MRRKSVPATLHLGDAVAAALPSELNDDLSARNYGLPAHLVRIPRRKSL
jgi:hypothetical protein